MSYEFHGYSYSTISGKHHRIRCLACGAESDQAFVKHTEDCEDIGERIGAAMFRIRTEKAIDECWERKEP